MKLSAKPANPCFSSGPVTNFPVIRTFISVMPRLAVRIEALSASDLGMMLGFMAGVLIYVSASHLLP